MPRPPLELVGMEAAVRDVVRSRTDPSPARTGIDLEVHREAEVVEPPEPDRIAWRSPAEDSAPRGARARPPGSGRGRSRPRRRRRRGRPVAPWTRRRRRGRTPRSRRGSRGRTRAARRTATDGPRSSRRPRGRPGSGRRRGGTGCWRASSRPSRRRPGGGRRGAAPSRRAAGRGSAGAERKRIRSRRYWSEWRRYSVTRIASPRRCGLGDAERRTTAGSPASSRWRRTSYSRSATSIGSSLSAYRTPSTTRNRTRCRDGPDGQVPELVARRRPLVSGSSQGRSSRPATSSRRRTGGTSPLGRRAGRTVRSACGVRRDRGVEAHDSNRWGASGRWCPAVTSRNATPSSRPTRSTSASSAFAILARARRRRPRRPTIRRTRSWCSKRGTAWRRRTPAPRLPVGDEHPGAGPREPAEPGSRSLGPAG